MHRQVKPPPSTVSAPAGPESSWGSAVAATLSGLDQSLITTADVGVSPDGQRRGPWLGVTVRCPSAAPGRCVQAEWEADLALGAVADRMAPPGQRDIADVIPGATITKVLPDGSTAPLDESTGAIAAHQLFAHGAGQDQTLLDKATSTIRADGFTPVSVTMLHPLDDALSVVVRVPDPAASSGSLGILEHDLLGSPPAFEGIYIEVDDPSGTMLGCVAASLRTGTGRFWQDPASDIDLGIVHGALAAPAS